MAKLKIEDLDKIALKLKGVMDLRKGIESTDAGHQRHVMVCMCTNCISNGAINIKSTLESELVKREIENEVKVVQTGAGGLCVNGPILIVQPDGIFYQYLKEDKIPNLVEEHFIKGNPVESLMYSTRAEDVPIPKLKDIPFFKDQTLIALRNQGLVDPDSIEDYIANDGYKALAKAISTMTLEEVIEEITTSGLRGRGGGGFPTGRKWNICRNATLKKKQQNPETFCYVLCNADEGDPGAFMDRSILEADPHSVIEGMCIGAYAMESTEGYIYVRTEYPLAIEKIKLAIKQAKEFGLLGKNILGSDFSFDLNVFQGAGAFVCGEETSLLHSIEGMAPEPEQKPPFPAESGLWGNPTNVNNVETWANIPTIINRGADWFSKIGTENSKGTKVFSLAGNVNNTGLLEVPMGITLQEMVYEIGDGIPNNKKFKGIQTGGPSGGIIPESLRHLPVDYERLKEAGAIMGSGGMIVLDEDTCMVDLAKYFLEFTSDESCGKCASCREGAQALYEILERICNGKGENGDIELLEEISSAIKEASMCGLGQTLPNPVMSSLRHFRNEYEAHINEKKCPAKACKNLITFTIDAENCTGCTACARVCPTEAISGVRKELHTIDQEKCIKCGLCRDTCKFNAVVVE